MRWRFSQPGQHTITTPLLYATLENVFDERVPHTLHVNTIQYRPIVAEFATSSDMSLTTVLSPSRLPLPTVQKKRQQRDRESRQVTF